MKVKMMLMYEKHYDKVIELLLYRRSIMYYYIYNNISYTNSAPGRLRFWNIHRECCLILTS